MLGMQEDILPQRRLVGRTIALYNPAQNRWLGVNNEGGAASPAQGDAFHPGWKWERFEVHDVGNDQVGLRNPETRRWLRVMDDRVESFAMGDWNDGWGASDRLQLRDAGDGHVGVYNPGSQRWVAVTPEGGTTAVRQGAGDVPRDSSNWERFRVELVDILPQRRLVGRTIALYNLAQNRWPSILKIVNGSMEQWDDAKLSTSDQCDARRGW